MQKDQLTTQQLQTFINQYWDHDVIPALAEFIKIPSKSIDFDPEWQSSGHLTAALRQIANWAEQQNIIGLRATLHQLPGCSPALLIDIPGVGDETILVYAHADKVPEASGWENDLGPWQPVLKDDRLYGRGSIDDGYAPFAFLTAIKCLQHHNIAHPRCVLFIETSEESGSPHFAKYLAELNHDIGQPNVIIVLDSGGPDNDRLWQLTSLRGHIIGVLAINVLTQASHSGLAGGIVPTPFSIARELLARVEDAATGTVLLKSANVVIPDEHKKNVTVFAELLGDNIYSAFPWAGQTTSIAATPLAATLNNTWKASLTVLGCDGAPAIKDAGNVILPQLKLKLALRTPPTSNAVAIAAELKNTLESNPPHNSAVSFTLTTAIRHPWCRGNANAWSNKLKQAAKIYYGKESVAIGCGAGIGAVSVLAEQFPAAEMIISGIDVPECNAHGPNEFVHIPTAKRYTCCLAEILKGV